MAEAELTNGHFEGRPTDDTAPNPFAEGSWFTEPIERITGRQVRGFISGIDSN